MALLVDTQIRNHLVVSGTLSVLQGASGSWVGPVAGNLIGTVTGALTGSVLGNVRGTASFAVSTSYSQNATTAITGSYTMTIAAVSPFSSAADTTYYFGAQYNSAYNNSETDNYKSFDSMSIDAPQVGTIRRAFIKYYCQTPSDTAEAITASIMSGSIVCGSGSFIPTGSVVTCRINTFPSGTIRVIGHPIALRLQNPTWASVVPAFNTLFCQIYIS